MNQVRFSDSSSDASEEDTRPILILVQIFVLRSLQHSTHAFKSALYIESCPLSNSKDKD